MTKWTAALSIILSTILAAPAALASSHCPPFAWHSIVDKGPQTLENVTGGKLPDGRTLALVKYHGEGGHWPKHSAVWMIKDGCFLGALVVARHGHLKTTDGEILYHVDHYDPASHRLFTAQVEEPTMKQVWDWGLQLMAHPPQ